MEQREDHVNGRKKHRKESTENNYYRRVCKICRRSVRRKPKAEMKERSSPLTSIFTDVHGRKKSRVHASLGKFSLIRSCSSLPLFKQFNAMKKESVIQAK